MPGCHGLSRLDPEGFKLPQNREAHEPDGFLNLTKASARGGACMTCGARSQWNGGAPHSLKPEVLASIDWYMNFQPRGSGGVLWI
jgi:hypothetical protein